VSKSQGFEIFLVAPEKGNDLISVQKPQMEADMLQLGKLYVVEDKLKRNRHTISEADVKCRKVYCIAEGCEEQPRELMDLFVEVNS
jgi:hypothetical protein